MESETRVTRIEVYESDDLTLMSSTMDLWYVDQVYAHAQTTEELQRLLDCAPPPPTTKQMYTASFLWFDHYPPQVPMKPFEFPPSIYNDRRRTLDVVEFTTEWVGQRIRQAPPNTIHIAFRRFEMLLRSHAYRDRAPNPFVVSLWPAEGPMDACLRTIGRWARMDLGSRRSDTPRHQESFGIRLDPPVWQMELELDLDHPRHLKDPREP